MTDIKWYLVKDWNDLGAIVSSETIAECPADYDMAGSLEVEAVAMADNYDIDFFRLPDGRIASVDLCGIVQHIDDSLEEAADYFSVGIL